jgi:hypothetical protein
MDANDVIVKSTEWSWTSNPMIALYIAIGVVVAAAIIWFIMRKTLRTRMGMERTLRNDPDVNDWLVVFGWTCKVLYAPSIIAALIAALLVFITRIPEGLVGGIWLGIVFINFLIEEYNINIRVLLISSAGVTAFLLWLHLLGWVLPFLRLFTHLAVSISPAGYVLLAIIGLLSIGISWLHGLFYYVAITPNCLNLHNGPTEAGEQIGREDYNTRVDTGDFLERLLGFGRIIITFKDNSRPPVMLLVWRVDKKAEMLERVREKFALDYPQGLRPGPPICPPPPDARATPPESDQSDRAS